MRAARGGSVMWNKKTGQGTYIMSIFKSASALVVGAVMSIGAVALPSVATAADLLPLKAKKPVVAYFDDVYVERLAVPEPSALALSLLGAFGLAAKQVARRRKS